MTSTETTHIAPVPASTLSMPTYTNLEGGTIRPTPVSTTTGDKCRFVRHKLSKQLFLVFCGAICTVSIILFMLALTKSGTTCTHIESCYYNVSKIPSGNTFVYSYQYVINNRYGCGNWCNEPMFFLSCPPDGYMCEVTQQVIDYCYYYGFEDLRSKCVDIKYTVLYFMSIFIFAISAILGYVLAWNWDICK
jgi:hypothetical protein